MHIFLPHIAYAQPSNLADVATLILNVVNSVVPVLISAGAVVFLWGVAQTILKTDDAEARKQGKKAMVYGVVSLFIITSLWGILRLVLNTFGL